MYIYSSVFSWRRNDMAESSSLRSGAGSAFHVDGPATAKAAWTVTDCPRGWNNEVTTHSGMQAATTKVIRNWLTCS